jgi:hypothetical protein
MLRKSSIGVGAGETRHNSVDADIAWTEFDGKATNESFNCAFGGCVGHGPFFRPMGSSSQNASVMRQFKNPTAGPPEGGATGK